MVGKLLSFWEGPSSGSMRVPLSQKNHFKMIQRKFLKNSMETKANCSVMPGKTTSEIHRDCH